MIKNKQYGFTLIELVATIILLGIIAVTVVPKFFTRSGFAEYALRDEVVSLLRFAQQRAMYDHSPNACYGVAFTASSVTVVSSDVALAGLDPIALSGDYQDLGVTGPNIYFDGLGNALSGTSCAASPSALTASETLTITGGDSLSITIYSSGYIK